MSDVWFTADTHFGHAGILRHCPDRPWSNVHEMDEGLIERWNARVRPGDRVYHLGDVSFHNARYTAEAILPRLNGELHLVVGNHDKVLIKRPEAMAWFRSVKDVRSLKVGNQRLVLCHFPMHEWDLAHHGSWHLHGHSHGNLGYDPQPRMDVGIDAVAGWAPVPFETVATYMRSREFTPVSHHG